MRLWSLHPKYLDPPGLVALWREALLAQAVLRGRTQGYRNHPQLARFRAHPAPRSAISAYLAAIHAEAKRRGYSFDKSKIGLVRLTRRVSVSAGQMEHEWRHLIGKLKVRNPLLARRLRIIKSPRCHPLFYVRPGGIGSWERNTTP